MAEEKNTNAEVPAFLLEILVCPLTGGALTYNRKAKELISPEAGLAFPVEAGVPVMLPNEARTLTAEEKAALKKTASK